MKRVMLILLIIFILLVLSIKGFLVFTYETLNVLEHLFYILVWFIITFLIIGTLYKIFKDYNSKKGVNPFPKYYNLNESDMFTIDIENIDGYKKIIKDKNGFILINEAGTFEIRFLYGRGNLTGDIKDKKWYLNKKQVDNPFILDGEVTRYLVLTKNLLVSVSGIRLITKTKLLFVLENHLNKKIINKKQIDEIFNSIEVKYGYNQN